MNDEVAITSEERARRAIDAMERAVVAKNLEVFVDAAHFDHIDPEEPETIPGEWVKELGLERAVRRHRVARYALLPPKDAPAGLAMAKAVITAVAKQKAVQINIGQLNVGKAVLVGEIPQCPEQEVER